MTQHDNVADEHTSIEEKIIEAADINRQQKCEGRNIEYSPMIREEANSNWKIIGVN